MREIPHEATRSLPASTLHQVALHIDDILVIRDAGGADVLGTAHRFNKAAVIFFIQLLIAATTFALKSAGRLLLTRIGPLGISGDCQMMRICFIRSG